MAKVKNGEMVLTDKAKKFYRLVASSENNTSAALEAGYSEKSAANMACRLMKVAREHPVEITKFVFGELGLTIPAVAARWKEILATGGEKQAVRIGENVLALWGASTKASDAEANQVFQIKGPTQINFKGESESSLRSKFDNLANPILPEKTED
ncbi:MAG: hypothetical protein ACXABY_10210 [Candidatus Thorarchaeota archaeon]|jgi:hypothetical protein